jgi:CheY-like chemotaxis protein
VHGTEIIGADGALYMQSLKSKRKSSGHLQKIEYEPMPYGRVLIVDDVETNLYVAEGVLMPYELNVETVDSAMLAIEKVKAGEVYDIIFMDHMMPEMDGVEATVKLREMGYNHPIIALSANAFSDMIQMFLDNGFTDFLPKPLDTNEINRVLIKHIRDKQPPEVIEQARAAKVAE